MSSDSLPRGIVSVVQTPFHPNGQIDEESLICLVNDAIASGVDGFLLPVVASEVESLTAEERKKILDLVGRETAGRVPIIVGASAHDPEECIKTCNQHYEFDVTASLVAVPNPLYQNPTEMMSFFRSISSKTDSPLIIQDLQFNGPGMDIETICQLRDILPNLAGLKIETVPAGPKYTQVRNALGPDFYIAGGWAVTQMIEALDRGVDAMMPESSMVLVYQAIYQAYRNGDRQLARDLFEKLLPVLSYTNQELLTSIAFFKRLLVRKNIFRTEDTRLGQFEWDEYNEKIAEYLIEKYLQLENEVRAV